MESTLIQKVFDGFATILKTNPTPLAIVAAIVVFACIVIYLARTLKGWQLVSVTALALLAPCVVFIYVIGNDDPKFVLLKQLDQKRWRCLDKQTGAACPDPPGAQIIDATTDVVIQLHSQEGWTTNTYGDVVDGKFRIIGNMPPDCSRPLPRVNLRGDVSQDWNTIEWNNQTKWVEK
ncbi:hypothetical protein PQR46_08055 [Paraburkholderia sediminicola]|uniref:hypothetical protein n=1 Tax=Paraburkholderia TaxID=1822464 RepID=UPI0038BBB5FC